MKKTLKILTKLTLSIKIHKFIFNDNYNDRVSMLATSENAHINLI